MDPCFDPPASSQQGIAGSTPPTDGAFEDVEEGGGRQLLKSISGDGSLGQRLLCKTSHHLIFMTEILSHNNDTIFFHIYDLLFLYISGVVSDAQVMKSVQI